MLDNDAILKKQEKLLEKQDKAIKVLLDRVAKLEADNKRLHTALRGVEGDIRTIAGWIRK